MTNQHFNNSLLQRLQPKIQRNCLFDPVQSSDIRGQKLICTSVCVMQICASAWVIHITICLNQYKLQMFFFFFLLFVVYSNVRHAGENIIIKYRCTNPSCMQTKSHKSSIPVVYNLLVKANSLIPFYCRSFPDYTKSCFLIITIPLYWKIS